MTRGPLAGRRVLLTRAEEQARATAADLESRGAEAVVVPLLAFTAPTSWKPLDAALARIASFDGIVLTSKNALAPLLDRGMDRIAGTKVWAVGPETAKAARDRGLAVAAMPAEFRGDRIASVVEGARRVLLVRAEEGREETALALRDAGIEVEVVAAYGTICPAEAGPQLAAAFARGLDAAVLTSPLAATHLRELTSGRLPGATVIAAIGPTTAARCAELGFPAKIVPNRHTGKDLVDALETYFGEHRG